jgi:hypothetical protein
MFTNIHDLAAETASNTNPAQVFIDYLSRPLYRISALRDGVTNFDASPAHFLGTYFQSGGTASSYSSKLEQIFQTVFNPVLFRDYQRRQTLASVALRPATYPTRFMNFYDLVFSASPANLSEMKVVFQSIAGAMKGNVMCPGDLASFFKSFSGQDILRHGYSFPGLPTWHHSPITFPTTSVTTRPARVSPDDFSAAIRFLRTPTLPTLVAATQPTGVCQTDRAHRVTVSFTSALNRLRTDNGTPPFPSFTSDFITFDESRHLFPKVYVFTLSGSTVDAWDATAFGLVIESSDLDGTVVPVPNTELSNGIENSWFADSCIPMRYCYWAIMHDTTATTSFARAMPRAIAPRQTRFPASSLLNDRTTVTIPSYNSQTVTFASAASAYPGLTTQDNVNWSTWIQRFLGFRTADNRSNTPDVDIVPGMTRHLLVWSPYTYVGYEGDNNFVASYSENRSYFVTNLRTIFGTDVPLVQVANGLESMPIA